MLKINGIQVAEPALEGITESFEDVWGPETGRNIKGTMEGDIVAEKTTVAVKWNTLTYAQASQLAQTLRSAPKFFSLYYFSVTNQAYRTITVYKGTLPFTLYSLNPNAQLYKDISVTFIEQ